MRLPRPRASFRRAMIAIAVLGIVLASARLWFIDNNPRDVLFASISALEGHYTIYSEVYRESRFRSLRAGMTARQVEDIMGPPLAKGRWMAADGGGPTTTEGGTLHDLWHYTRAGKSRGNYWRREVWFRDGLVYATDRSYYLD